MTKLILNTAKSKVRFTEEGGSLTSTPVNAPP